MLYEIRDTFEHLLQALEMERKAEMELFAKYLKESSIPERIKNGVCWFPLIIKETGYGMGEYPFLVVERPNHKEQSHQFQGGKIVQLFSTKEEEERAIQGVVHYVDGDTMKLLFFSDELPDWVDDGKIGVQLLYDERSYKEMEKALKIAMGARNCRLAELVRIIYGTEKPLRQRVTYTPEAQLNAAQHEAVQHILEARDIAVVHGPPGTGKTTTLVEAIRQITTEESPVLVCAPSNAAVDHITIQLAQKGLQVVRIGNIGRIDEALMSHTVEECLLRHPRFTELREYKRRAQEYKRMAGKYKRSFGKQEREQRELLYREARELTRESQLLEEYLVAEIIHKADVITATLVGVESRYLAGIDFSTVVIDEAAQALEPAVWIAINRGRKIIMAGDPFQLPPTVKSNDATGQLLKHTLMEKLLKSHPDEVKLLNVQYRMHEKIMGYSNRFFYQNQLQADAAVAQHTLPLEAPLSDPLEWIDTAGTGFEEETPAESRSLINPGEITIILQHFEQLLAAADFRPFTVAFISPYRAQAELLQERIKHYKQQGLRVKAETIDSFQGQESDVVYISMVRSNTDAEIGFLADYRRMNVAMTRARKKLVMVGDSATMGNDAFYSGLLAYCEQNEAYHSAWMYLA